MIIVNLIASFFLLSFFIFYLFVYPKKRIPSITLLIFLSFLPLTSMLRSGTYESGDLSINAIKTMAYADAVQDGHFPPQWAEELNATYGYPLFLFTYPLPYFLSFSITLLGFSFISSIKVFLAISFILSGFTFYLWAKNLFGEKSGLVGTIFYLFAPYHLVDMHFRATMGEMLAFVFVPLCLYSIDKFIRKSDFKWFSLLSVSVASLVLSHQAIALVSIPFIIIYFLFTFIVRKKLNVNKLIILLFSLATGLLLSSFYFLPVLIESRYTHQAVNATVEFLNISQLLYSPWMYGLLFQGHFGELSFHIGYIQLIIILLSILLLTLHKVNSQDKQLLLFFIICFFFTTFMMTEYSKPIWNTFSMLKNIQFSYRLFVLVTLFISAIAAIVVKTLNNKSFTLFICIIALSSTILNWGNRRTIPEIDDIVLLKQLPESSYSGEGLYPAMPRWTNEKQPFMSKVPLHHLEITSGSGSIKEISRTTTEHRYHLILEESSTLKENTLYFPGWMLKVNNKTKHLELIKGSIPGIISFSLPQGEHEVLLQFKDTQIRTLASNLSLVTLGILILVGLTHFIKKLRLMSK